MAATGNAHRGTPPAGALTTQFLPPEPKCTVTPEAYTDKNCMPPNFSGYFDGDVGYYSPAICPQSWTIATVLPTKVTGLGPPIEPTETAAVCCPQ